MVKTKNRVSGNRNRPEAGKTSNSSQSKWEEGKG